MKDDEAVEKLVKAIADASGRISCAMHTVAWMIFVGLVLVASCSLTVRGGEREEVGRLAPKYEAETEVVLFDRTRVDLLNDEYAIEVDWAPKWAEAIGQSLYYATVTGRKPAIILLTKGLDDRRFVYRCLVVCARTNIRLYLEPVEP